MSDQKSLSDQNFQLNGKWPLYLLRNEKFAKSNSFEADLRHAEVTDMKSESAICDFKLFSNFLLFTS